MPNQIFISTISILVDHKIVVNMLLLMYDCDDEGQDELFITLKEKI